MWPFEQCFYVIERLSFQPTGSVSNWESFLTTVYSLFTFIKNEFPAFSMQGIIAVLFSEAHKGGYFAYSLL